MPKRQYFTIERYEPGMEGDLTVLDRIKTSLRGECDGHDCQTFEQLGPLSLVEDTWQSACTDRRSKAGV